MEYREDSSLIFVRLHQNEDLFETLRHICRECNLTVGVIVSGIGMLKQAELNYYVESGRYSPILLPEPLELVSLTGSIIHQDGECHVHVHAVLARENKETVAGHLSRAKVNVTSEIVMLKTNVPAIRKMDPKTGLMALTFGGEKHEPDSR
jgi:predicted DNA-binding protein with PD1-like motif